MHVFAQKSKSRLQPASNGTTSTQAHLTQERDVDSILRLRSAIGKQAVQRLPQSNNDELTNDVTGTASPQLWHDFSQIPVRPSREGAIQTKVAINTPGDEYEQEADYVAEHVMRMPEPKQRQYCPCGGTCPKCGAQPSGQESKRLHAKHIGSKGNGKLGAPSLVQEVVRSPGQLLGPEVRAFMEPRFGHDFSGVRIHTGLRAAESARDLNALAYTLGEHIVFGAGQFAPDRPKGRRLLAHELAHVVQQSQTLRRDVIQRYEGCTGTQNTATLDDHARARTMLSRAITAIHSYDGANPAKVRNELARHFHGATGSAFAAWVNVNLRYLWAVSWIAEYECYTGGVFERAWACGSRVLATTFWCVPGVDIRLCPAYFGQSDTERSTTLIHEWVHKYGCNFDLGYEHEADYTGNRTVTQLLNADSFASFIRDVQ